MKMLFRLLVYILGLFVCSFGVAFAVNSGLGVSPVTSFAFGVSRVVGGGDPIPYLGTCVSLSSILFIGIQLLLQRKDFMLKGVLQFPFSLLFGMFVDATKAILGDFTIPTYFGKLAMLAIALVCIGMGIGMYLSVDLVSMPNEGMGQVFAKKLNRPYHQVKVWVDCACVAFSIIISLIFFGNFDGIREGTIITALLAGRVLGVCLKFLKPAIYKVCGDIQAVKPESPALHMNITIGEAMELWAHKKAGLQPEE